jgi:hypothetical protein
MPINEELLGKLRETFASEMIALSESSLSLKTANTVEGESKWLERSFLSRLCHYAYSTYID